MANFLRVGRHFINLDDVSRIFKEDRESFVSEITIYFKNDPNDDKTLGFKKECNPNYWDKEHVEGCYKILDA